MQIKAFFPVLVLLAGVSGATAQPGPILARQNTTLTFPLSSLTANGVPGLTNPPSKLMVATVPAQSALGGNLSVVNTQVWVRRYNAGYNSYYNSGAHVVTDGDGNVIVNGFSYRYLQGYGCAMIKYAGDGTALWTNRYDGSSGDTYYISPGPLAVDKSNNVVMTAGSTYPETNTDAVTIRYTPGGIALTTNHYYSSTNADLLVGMALDPAGNVCVALASFSPDTEQHGYLTVKYDTLGNAVWTNFYKFLTNGSDYTAGIAADEDGNVFVMGSSDDIGGTRIATLKYSPDGTSLWTNRYRAHLYGDLGRTITIDRAGRVLVAAEAGNGTAVSYPVIEYSNDGTPLWTNVLAGPNYSGGAVPQIATDVAGNVFVISGTPGTSTIGICDILKLNHNGVPLWTNLNVSFGVTNAGFHASTVDHAGNLYLTGYSGGTNSDFVTMKFAGDGTALWTNRYDGPAGGTDYANALTVDDAGNVYVTGQSAPVIGMADFATLKYSDYVVYTPPTNFVGTDTFTFVATDATGNTATGLVQIVVSPATLEFNPGSLQWDSQGLHLQVDGALGTNAVVLYASTNLSGWIPVATNPPALGSAQFLDLAARNFPRRFYRAAQPPP